MMKFFRIAYADTFGQTQPTTYNSSMKSWAADNVEIRTVKDGSIVNFDFIFSDREGNVITSARVTPKQLMKLSGDLEESVKDIPQRQLMALQSEILSESKENQQLE